VTELVSGIDLVREQIRVASGEPLSFGQDDIDLRGHAIEIRVNAENPAGGRFLPAPGRITTLVPPQGFGVRWDGGYESGDEVSQYYDNLIGKLIVWGSDRRTAIGRMKRAIREFRIAGIATTLPADMAILSADDFVEARHSTKWVEDTLDLSGIDAKPAPASEASTEGGEPEPRVRRDVDVEVNGKRFQVALWVPESAMGAAPVGGGAAAGVAKARPKRAGGGGAAAVIGSGSITVPMQGTIVKVNVAEGDQVEAGAVICVLEAMKMENNITADMAGTVKELKVTAGQAVGSGDIVAVIA
jgi:acetyl-CoA/propionyl-CoA carboxylase biotin carboxyl carrier protein